MTPINPKVNLPNVDALQLDLRESALAEAVSYLPGDFLGAAMPMKHEGHPIVWVAQFCFPQEK